jgi:hypothetical protein
LIAWQRRWLRPHAAALSICLGAASLLGGACSNADETRRAELRRQILRGQNLEKEQAQRREQTRVTTFDGDLLPSETKVAGVVIPRGFEPKFNFEYEWYFDGAQPLAKLEKYVLQHMDAATVERPDSVAILFTQARTKGVSDMRPVTIKIFPVPGRSDWSRINIVGSRPLPEHIPTAEEVAAQLAERRAHME